MRSLVLSDSAAEKLARLLLSWGKKTGGRTEHNIHLKLSLTHGEIAQMIGVSRETVTRLLEELRDKRIIQLKGSNLLIKSKAALVSRKHPGQRLRSRVSPVHDDSGKIIAYLMVVRDITETVAHEREINRRQHAARFGELAASLAHEIKNPLAGIQGAVDIMIQRRSPNDPERKLLEGVRGEVGRVDAIISSMLDRARPGVFNFQPASVNAAAHRAVTLAGHQAKAALTRGRQIKIEFVADPSPIVMNIDAAQIEDAVHGPLTNAIEAIDGHGAVIVRLGECDNADGNGREVVIEVKDSGRGISEADLSRIFSPFFGTNPNGAGLGLPAVRRIARAHGGRVEVDSAPGRGSTFTIRLPRESMALEEK